VRRDLFGTHQVVEQFGVLYAGEVERMVFTVVRVMESTTLRSFKDDFVLTLHGGPR